MIFLCLIYFLEEISQNQLKLAQISKKLASHFNVLFYFNLATNDYFLLKLQKFGQFS